MIQHNDTITMANHINNNDIISAISVEMIFSLLAINERRILDILPHGFDLWQGAIYSPEGEQLHNSDEILFFRSY